MRMPGWCLTALLLTYFVAAKDGQGQSACERALPGWKTNTARRSIELSELDSGGPGKDGIPAVDRPRFVKVDQAREWVKDVEPVVSLVVGGKAKAYPLQILIWHEIINDRIGDVPVVVTFCPLCYSAIAFERKAGGKEYTFGVSGMLRYSNLVMYDRQTESLWQQMIGEAIVGDMTGTTLKSIPAQIVSFEQFAQAHPEGPVLSRETGMRRPYGRNPYAGYDDIRKTPFMYRGPKNDRLPPMEKVIAVSIGGTDVAYPYPVTRKERAINDEVGGKAIVVFHGDGAVSAVDGRRIAQSREVGSTGVFERTVDGQTLTFNNRGDKLVDEQTGSTWHITGQAVDGPLKGKKLSPITHGDYFAFAWLVFKPQTQIYHHTGPTRRAQ